MIFDDVRSDHDDHFLPPRRILLRAEEIASQRDVAQEGDLRLADRVPFAEQTTDDDGVAVFDHDITGDFGRVLGRQPVHNAAIGIFRMDFHADKSVIGNERPEYQAGASFKIFDRLGRGSAGGGRRVVTIFSPDDDHARLLIEREHLGVGQDDRVGDLFEGVDEQSDVVVRHADVQTLVVGAFDIRAHRVVAILR